MEDAPEIFGLHENADITLQQKDTKSIIDTVILVAGSGSGGGGGQGSDLRRSDQTQTSIR